MKVTEMISLSEAIPNEKIFDYMPFLSFVPSAEIAGYLDAEYFYNRSGTKQASPMVLRLRDRADLNNYLGMLLLNRYRTKWENLFEQYSKLETLDLLSNIKSTREALYGKTLERTGSDTLRKSGTETSTLNGEQVVDETFPENRASTRTISGGWQDSTSTTDTRTGKEQTVESFPETRKTTSTTTGGYADTDTTATTRTGTEETTESFPTERKSVKATTGGYGDSDSTTTTRTGSQSESESGSTNNSVYGFNSSTPVPSSVTSPSLSKSTTYNSVADAKSGSVTRTYNGLTETTTESGSAKTSKTFGADGLKDTHSGAITRAYSDLKEEKVESGSRKVETSYGDGLQDASTGTGSRTYNNYSDTVTETGSKRIRTSFGSAGKTDTLSFSNREDSHILDITDTHSGTDTITEVGYRYKSLIEEFTGIFMSAQYLDFLSIVFDDCDEILTSPFYAV